MNWKEVSQKEFYAGIGNRNVHPQIQNEKWPYWSLWKTPRREILGKTVGMKDGKSKYYLPN